MHLIGFMQGRLCDQVNGKIQAFPWHSWESEFPAAAEIGIRAMEWTLDQERLHENPLLTPDGQHRISLLCQKYQFVIPSVTGDCFMQAPFWKAKGGVKAELQADFQAICEACSVVGARILVVPLVDDGRLEDSSQEDELIDFLLRYTDRLRQLRVQVIFESDFAPQELNRFMGRLPSVCFGVNYDIGNSAALGFEPSQEFESYGSRVMNVHVKDRVFGGTTVPLGMGSAQFDVVFAELRKMNYQGNFILQTARAPEGNHADVLGVYRDMTADWIANFMQ